MNLTPRQSTYIRPIGATSYAGYYGLEAYTYYSNAGAGNYVVNPDNGVRYDNGQIFGTYISGVNNTSPFTYAGINGYEQCTGYQTMYQSVWGQTRSCGAWGGGEHQACVNYCTYAYSTGWH